MIRPAHHLNQCKFPGGTALQNPTAEQWWLHKTLLRKPKLGSCQAPPSFQRCPVHVPASQHSSLTDAVDEIFGITAFQLVFTVERYIYIYIYINGHMLRLSWVERFHEMDQDGVIQIGVLPWFFCPCPFITNLQFK